MGSGPVRAEPAVARPAPRRRLWILAAAAVVLILAAAFRAPLLSAAGRWLDVGEPPRKTDCVYVLPGEYNTRPLVAAALYRAGLAGKVVLPTSRPTPDETQGRITPHHEITRRVLLARGVPEDEIVVLPDESTSTFDDAQALARWVGREAPASVAVVTNDYHTRRARWILRRVLAGAPCELHLVSAPTDFYTADNWWRDADGFLAYTSEFIKFAFYQLRYGRALAWLGSAAALAALVWAGQRARRRQRSAG